MWAEPRLLVQAPGCPPSTHPPTPAASCGWASGEAGEAFSRAASLLPAAQALGVAGSAGRPAPALSWCLGSWPVTQRSPLPRMPDKGKDNFSRLVAGHMSPSKLTARGTSASLEPEGTANTGVQIPPGGQKEKKTLPRLSRQPLPESCSRMHPTTQLHIRRGTRDRAPSTRVPCALHVPLRLQQRSEHQHALHRKTRGITMLT